MKRKISILVTGILMLLCLCFAFAACGKAPEGPSSGTGTEQGGTPSGDPTEPDDKDQPHDHVYTAENVCEVCGAEWQYSEGLLYTQKDDGTYSVTGIGTASGEVVLPYGHEGKFVTSIGDSAFQNSAALTGIIIPDSVTSIGNRAFQNSAALTGITIPDSVTAIGYNAFTGTPVYENEANWENNEVFYLGRFLIKAKTTLAGAYTVRENTKSIAAQAFYGCSALTGITIPASVKEIGDSAFSGCPELSTIAVAEENQNYSSQDNVLYNKAKTKIIIVSKKIEGELTILGSVTEIDSTAFTGCNLIGSFAVAEENTVYSSQDGVLYDKGKTEIVCVPQLLAGEITIPGSLEAIGDGAFQGRSGLTSVKMEIGLTSIGTSAFSGCDLTGEVYIPGSVKSIGRNAFFGCNNITSMTIPFTGSGSPVDSNKYFGYIFSGRNYSGIPTSLKSVTIHSSTIEESAFWSTALESITVAEGAKSIGKGAFGECKSLRTISLPSSLNKFDTDSAFQNCISLETINYAGTKDQWEKIYTSVSALKKVPQVVLHCTDGDFDYQMNRISE